VRVRGNEREKVVAGIVATIAFVRWRSDARRALVREPGSNIEGASNFGRKRQSWRRLVVASQHRGESPRRPGPRCVLSTRMFSQTCARWPTN
jgi:hypothetical protein